MDNNKYVYTKLRELRRSRGITVDELAKELGENSQKVGRIERGKRSLTVDYLMKISKVLSAPIEAFLGDSKEKTASKENPSFDSNILNDVIVMVEELCTYSSKEYTSQQKAKIISQLYEMILKIPTENQLQFIKFFKDSLKLFFENI